MGLSGVHHLALCTNDMKAQIDFFTQAVGMKLVGLIPMHGAEGAAHSFLKAGDDSYLSFVEFEGVNIAPQVGVSHAKDAVSPVAGGAMQHVSFKVDTLQEMFALRDRLRSHGYAVLGPLNHGLNQSMYLGAPEGILLEFSTPDASEGLTTAWIDDSVAEKLGISPEELARYRKPDALGDNGGTVPQPSGDDMVFPTPIPSPMFAAIGYLDDEQLAKAVNLAPPSAEPVRD